MDNFGDYIIVLYHERVFFDIFRKNGKLKERKYVSGDDLAKIHI
jgi:hypothetical protein